MDSAVKHPQVWRELQNARLAYKRALERREFRTEEFNRAVARLLKAQAAAKVAGFVFRPRRTSNHL